VLHFLEASGVDVDDIWGKGDGYTSKVGAEWGIAHEYQAATLEIKVFESVEMLLFKPSRCFESSLVDFGVESVDIGGTFL
jgi:hypothetical protein